MMNKQQKIMIGVSPRERFAVAAEALSQLFAATPELFRLVIIDCATPDKYWREIEPVLAGRANVRVIRREEYLLPNQSRNILTGECRPDEWVCLLENDVFVQDGWLTSLMLACNETGADAAVPLIIEGNIDGKVHFDKRMGRIEPVTDAEHPMWSILPPVWDFHDMHASRRMQQVIEDHCVLYRPGVIHRLPTRDEELNTRELIELAMSLHSIEAKVVFEPASRVVFKPPPLIEREERDFFAHRWNRERADASRLRVVQRWNLDSMPSSARFVDKRLGMLQQ